MHYNPVIIFKIIIFIVASIGLLIILNNKLNVKVNSIAFNHKLIKYTPSLYEQHVEEWLKQDRIAESLCTNKWPEETFIVETNKYDSEIVLNQCGSQYNYKIEPLTRTLRHPLAVCEDYMLNKSFLKPINHPSCGKTIVIDIGSSVWNEGSGGASLSWLNEMHAPDEIYAWEINAKRPIFDGIPISVIPKLHYFNEPANPYTNMNPALILDFYTLDDYIVIKLDVDDMRVEPILLEQLLLRINKIDEFYYENHCNFYNWQHRKVFNMSNTQYDSFLFFKDMRNKGVIAHSWV
jgi:hypothetical protein